ncbi:DUF4157 domain-containing protein [Phormidium sp. CLA17]|uniref:eCIS core domain-containing protein n=1 Tax=Leptolyngbya sp. Cla-17 TaxID=2803751 RepID=UPI001491915E|nr:DUF4157 domain-containing protein [Leptolyngbya sp. Cla-17]MBM0740406.1 DUF4157 domain-containing protein [Leptolyngbya sp. Cla-17]
MVHLAERTKRRKTNESHAGQHDSSKPSRLPISPLAMRSPLVQPKLTVNQPGDKFEQEADTVASAVMRTPVPLPQPDDNRASIQRMAAAPTEENAVQRQTAPKEETVQRQSLPEDKIQRLATEEVPVQRKGDGSPRVSTSTVSTIHNPGSGSPLPSSVRHRVEPHVGANLSGVRVHTGPSAQRAAASLNARAFTHGNNIFLNRAESSSNLGLMAHESTHVVQQGAAPIQRQPLDQGHSPIHSSSPPSIQRLLPSIVLSELDDYARQIPGYTLFTVIIGFNPLKGEDVARNATNLLAGLMGLVPFGTYVFDKLQEHGILQSAFTWVKGELNRLDLSVERIERTLNAAWTDVRLAEGFDYNLAVLRRHFGGLYNDVVAFATSLVNHIIELIKEAVVGVAEGLLAENRAWALIKKILHHDPLRDQPVNATTVEILEDFLRLIGKEQELEQMRSRGTLEETAAWIDTQIGTFMSLLGELRGLFTEAWNAIQPENLPQLRTNLQSLVSRAGGFLVRVGTFAITVAAKVLELIKHVLLGLLRDHARGVPGYPLLTVLLGKDPFTQEEVPRNATNLIRGFMSLMPNGEQQFQQMQETGVIPEAAQRIETAMTTLGITWPFVQQLFIDIWNSFTIEDLLHPIDAFIRILTKFEEPLSRLFTFVIEVIKVVLELALKLMNFPTDLIGSIIANAMQAIDDIQRDPVGFLLNLLAAVKLGFNKFLDNILTHLLNGLTNWLFGQLSTAGIHPPADLSLGSILDLVLQILGLTVDRLWEKLGERIGQENVTRIRGAIDRLTGIWTFVKDVQEQGIAAVWKYIESQISNLWSTVLEQVESWVMTQVIQKVTAKLLSMLDPTGIMAVVNSFIAFFNAIQSAIEYFRQILEIVNSFVSTVAEIARGSIEGAAQFLENTLAQSLPVAIGFLANQVGLGNLGERIAEIIGSIRELIDRALNWLMDQAMNLGRAVLRSLGFGSQEGAASGDVKDQAGQAVQQQIGKGKSQEEIEAIGTRVLNQFRSQGLSSLALRRNDAGEFALYAAASPEKKVLDLMTPDRAGENYAASMTARITIANPREGLDISESRWEDARERPQGAATVEEFLKKQAQMPVIGQGYRERRGAQPVVTSLIVARPQEGANEILLRTFSGGGRIRGRTTDNSSHAEVRLKEFLQNRAAWTSRISKIELHINFSPCRLCGEQRETMRGIRAMLTGISDISNAILSWDTWYDDSHIGTRAEDISHLRQHWTISGPMPSNVENASEKLVPASS